MNLSQRSATALRAFESFSGHAGTEYGRMFSNMSKTRRDNRMRFFIMNGKVQSALEMLKNSLDQTPVIAEKEFKYLKLPPPSVCNKVLHSVAQEGSDASLGEVIRRIVPALRRKGVDVAPRTVVALYQACERVKGGQTMGDALVREHLDAQKEGDFSACKDTLSCLLENQVAARNKSGVMDCLRLMQKYNAEPSAHDAFTMLRLYLYGDEQRTARNFLSWVWFNGIYCSGKKGTVGYIQDADFCISSSAGHVFGQRALVLIRDVSILEKIPEVVVATALGMCALERSVESSSDILSMTEKHRKGGGRLLQSTLLHLYTRTQQDDALIKCVTAALADGAVPPKIVLEPIVMDAESNPEFVQRVLAALSSHGVALPMEIQNAFSTATGKRL